MGHFSSSGYTALACNSIGNRKPSHYLQKSSRKEQFLCQEKTNTNICFKSLVTVYIKGLKMRIEYILMKTLSSLGMEVILLKLLIRKLTVCQVSYGIHYKWAFKTVMEIGKPKCKNVLALSNFLWSSLETQFSGMMLKCWVKTLKVHVTAQHSPRRSRKIYWWNDLLLATGSSESDGEDGLEKNKCDINTTTKACTEAKSSRSQSN